MPKNRPTPKMEEARAEESAGLALDRKPSSTIDMHFQKIGKLALVDDPIWEDVSALAVQGRSIFATCDETSTIERILFDPETGRAEGHVNFALGDTFDLPDGPDGEMDIEGLSIADGYLWACGSHSLKRDKIEDGDIYDLDDLDWDPNRGFLGRVPLMDRGDGVFDPVGAYEPLDGTPALKAAMVALDKDDVPIRKMLKKDPLIGPYIDHPCKENGFDIEGLAVFGDTVLLGLRGPVIGGYAMIVRLEMKTTKKGYLKPKKIDGKKRYTLQAVDLNGLAIRDMCWQNGRLLLLTGATTDLEALQSVVAIEDYDPDKPVYPSSELKRVLDLPILRGADHAEGLALIEIDGEEKMIIAHDSPHRDRVDEEKGRLTADIFDMGQVKPAGSKKKKKG